MLGVVKLAPVAILVPPVAAAYHCATPDEQVAPKVAVPVPQIVAGVTVGAEAFELIVAIAEVLGVDSHPSGDLQLT